MSDTPYKLDDAQKFLETVIPWMTRGKDGFLNYEYWIDDCVPPDVRHLVTHAARQMLNSPRLDLLSSAIQAIGVTGDEHDIELIAPLLDHESAAVSHDAVACIAHIRHRFKSWPTRLSEVCDRDSLCSFALDLAHERGKAEEIELQNPSSVEPALGWVNRSISEFLRGSLTFFDAHVGNELTWQNLGQFLYWGKIRRAGPSSCQIERPAPIDVTDRHSFLCYACNYVNSRQIAEQLQVDRPEDHPWGAPGWAHDSISEFIGAGVSHFEHVTSEQPAWSDLESFLFHGMIIE